MFCYKKHLPFVNHMITICKKKKAEMTSFSFELMVAHIHPADRTNHSYPYNYLRKNTNQHLGFPISDDDYIFLRQYKGKVTSPTDICFNGRLEKYCRQMGIPVKSCHDIRRTAITNLDDAGMPTKALQAFAGHSTEAMTLSYIKGLSHKQKTCVRGCTTSRGRRFAPTEAGRRS
jgi:integrase